jgi:hypothetical protein
MHYGMLLSDRLFTMDLSFVPLFTQYMCSPKCCFGPNLLKFGGFGGGQLLKNQQCSYKNQYCSDKNRYCSSTIGLKNRNPPGPIFFNPPNLVTTVHYGTV